MKRRWRLLWVWVAVVFLLLFPHHRLSLSAGDRCGVGSGEFICTWCRTSLAARPAFSPSQASALEMCIIYFEFLVTDNVGPPWLDHRGPPGARAYSGPWVRCKAAGQAGCVSSRQRISSEEIPDKKQTRGFSTGFS